MTIAGRRAWISAALLLAVLIGVGTQLAVQHVTREAPNYSQIEPGLWLGGAVREPPPGVTAVLNLCEAADGYRVASSRWEPIRDAPPAPDLDWLAQQVEFIEANRARGRSVYVHCQNGVSRSAFVTAAYLMQREHWSRDQAIEFLRERRPGVRPNPAFLARLAEWERNLAKGGAAGGQGVGIRRRGGEAAVGCVHRRCARQGMDSQTPVDRPAHRLSTGYGRVRMGD